MIKNQKGFLLPMATVFIVVMSIVGMGILYLGALEKLGAKRQLTREKAFYLAEAGAYRAYAHLKEDREWEPEDEPLQLGDGTFLVVLEQDENNRSNIISTGVVSGFAEKVQITIASGRRYRNSWAQGLFGSASVTLQNNVKIYGYDSSADPYGDSPNSNAQVGSILNINLQNNSKIYGDASVTSDGLISYINNSKITGNENTEHIFDEPLNALPSVIIPSDLLIASPGGQLKISQGSSTYSLPGGDYRYESITTQNNTTLNFTGSLTRIYVEKTVTIENNSRWNIQGTLILYLGENSNFYVKNNSKVGIMQDGHILPNLPVNFQIYSASTENDAVVFENNSDMAGLLYVPEGKIIMENNRKFLGGIVAKDLDLYNNVKILYDSNLNNVDVDEDPGNGSGTGEFNIIKWTKPGWANRLQ